MTQLGVASRASKVCLLSGDTGGTLDPMSQSYEQLLTALRDRSGLVHLDVLPPRDAPTKQLVASLFEPAPCDPPRPQGQAISVTVTPEQATELLAAGAEWKGPAHMRADVL